ncbi:cobalt-precorrin-6A reductase [Trichothermofontia sichuanensis B231]|uniref:cobalt-precorrin-6A reductase n=1 Tax=Trichothermofontia sichuanensis TaxID=3045816 RepID=UPI00224854F2|nr:cobalt-precorrin-6A reductase [Trichothermofontia sichuanensis]UZQ54922.1 cobalt-precorrin-6A reductase [Trichothermofontia sichuanensis B231]
MVGHIWLIGGTQESAQLAAALSVAQLPWVVSVTTENARDLYRTTQLAHPDVQIWVGRLNDRTIDDFLGHYQVTAILDASHPFAVEISQLAIAAAQRHVLPYLRYERPAIPPSPDAAVVSGNPEAPLFRRVDSLVTLLRSDTLQGERVLLTLGYRSLPAFAPWQSRATLFARILPSPIALETALAAGFTPDRIIALRPPLSLDLERALWQHWHISLVVTKASGEAGGETMKRQLAQALGIPLVTIARPTIAYPQQTQDIPTAIAFCQQAYRRQV